MIFNFLKVLFLIYLVINLFKSFKTQKDKIIKFPVLLITNKQNRQAVLITLIFVIIFIFLFRFIRLFLIKNNSYLDLKIFLNFFFNFLKLSYFDFLLLSLFTIVVLILCKKLIIFYIKLNYLRVHYLHLYKSIFYRKIVFFIQDHEYMIFKKLKEVKIYFIFFKFIINFLLRFLILGFFLKNLIFDDMIIYLGFLPFYAFYYLIISIIEFFKKMEIDFEKGSLQFYFQENFSLTKLGLKKLNIYHTKLITSHSKYHFMNSIIYDYRSLNQMPNYWVFFCYKDINIAIGRAFGFGVGNIKDWSEVVTGNRVVCFWTNMMMMLLFT